VGSRQNFFLSAVVAKVKINNGNMYFTQL
jgi:hypothetical protein